MPFPHEHLDKLPFGQDDLVVRTGDIANQAGSSLIVSHGDTCLLVAVTSAKEDRDTDFFPLSVEYEERMYAAGKISGSRFLKREGRPSEEAVLKGRIADRSIRPLFPKQLRRDVQIVITTLSYDDVHDTSALAVNGASIAIMRSGLPFSGPVAAVKVGIIDGELIINPTNEQMASSTLDLLVSATKDRVTMIEAASKEIPDEKMHEAITFAHASIKKLIASMEEVIGHSVKEIFELPPFYEKVLPVVKDLLAKAVVETDKSKQRVILKEAESKAIESLSADYEPKKIVEAVNYHFLKQVRKLILKDGKRPDGRDFDELRSLVSEVALLPRVHGSGLFARGETQALTIATLAAPSKEQWIDTMEEESRKRYMHHYNFPPYSVGETGRVGASSRREIGHGALAEKALVPVLPSQEEFPYTIRLVSEILSSNGSTSMASVCGSTLALMDAGVPIKKPVAGIAMGLMTGDNVDDFKVLTDLQGLEDFSGDMDFKIAGTKDGITAIQLDVKIEGLTEKIIAETLAKAKVARDKILEKINQTLPAPRSELSPFAPRITSAKIDPEKIGEFIGPGGKNINKLIDANGGADVLSIDIEDDGTVMIVTSDVEVSKRVKEFIDSFSLVIEVGAHYEGEVMSIIKDRNTGSEIGAVVQLTPNKDGMIHISALSNERVEKVSDVVKIGDKVGVTVTAVDAERGRISLVKDGVTPKEKTSRPPFRGGNGGGFNRDRKPRY